MATFSLRRVVRSERRDAVQWARWVALIYLVCGILMLGAGLYSRHNAGVWVWVGWPVAGAAWIVAGVYQAVRPAAEVRHIAESVRWWARAGATRRRPRRDAKRPS
ncbi:MAG TPA: hypothetical protein VE197_23715 [Mycobacterium sp.]|nr:hypothetical protein [Mycobacterium sp.]